MKTASKKKTTGKVTFKPTLEIEMVLRKWVQAFPLLDPKKQVCKCGKKMTKQPRFRILKEHAVLDYGQCPCGKKALFKQRLDSSDIIACEV